MAFITRMYYSGGFHAVNIQPQTHVVYCTGELLEKSPEFRRFCEENIIHYVIDEADYFVGNLLLERKLVTLLFLENGHFRPSYLWLPTFLSQRPQVRITLLSGSVPTPLHAQFLACWSLPCDTPTVACRLVRSDFFIDMIQVNIYLIGFDMYVTSSHVTFIVVARLPVVLIIFILRWFFRLKHVPSQWLF
jgi:hypothetical protein